MDLIEAPGRMFELRSGAEPSRLIALPFEARPRPILHWAYGVGLSILALLGAVLILSTALAPRPGFGQIAVALSLGGFMLVWAGGASWTLIADVVRGVGIRVDAAGFHDRRSGMDVAWRDVRVAEYRYARVGIAGLALQLHTPTRRRQNPFRPGYDRRRREELVVPMKFLTPDSATLSFVFERLIEDAGGEIVGRPARARA